MFGGVILVGAATAQKGDAYLPTPAFALCQLDWPDLRRCAAMGTTASRVIKAFDLDNANLPLDFGGTAQRNRL